MSPAEQIYASLKDLRLPAELGRIEFPKPSVAQPQLVVAHVVNERPGNHDAIKNGAEIIRILGEKCGFEVVFTDGAEGGADFSVWDRMHPKMREWFANQLLGAGYIQAPELAVVLFPHAGIELFGVEDRELYRTNWRAARQVVPTEGEAVRVCEEVKTALTAFTRPLSRDLREAMDRRWSYERARTAYMDKPAGSDECERAAMKEARIAWLSHLSICARWLGMPFPAETVAKLAEFGVLNDEEVHSLKTAQERGSQERFFYEKTDIVDRFSASVAKSLARTRSDEAYLFLLRMVELMISGCKLKLNADEALQFLQISRRRLQERIESSVATLNAAHAATGDQFDVEFQLPTGFGNVLGEVKAIEEFYRCAMLRGVVVANKLAGEMVRRRIDRAIVCSTGFQIPFMAGVLAFHHRTATVLIYPNIKDRTGDGSWKERVLEESDEDTPASPDRTERSFKGVGEAPPEIRRLQEQADLEWELLSLDEPRLRHALLAKCEMTDHEVVLNVDCGDGKLLSDILRKVRNCTVIGIDNYWTNLTGGADPGPAARLLARAGRSSKAVLINGLSRSLPFQDGIADVVVTDSVDRIFNAGECRGAIREMIRAARPNGQIVVLSGRWRHVIEAALMKEGVTDLQVQSLDRSKVKDAQGFLISCRKPR